MLVFKLYTHEGHSIFCLSVHVNTSSIHFGANSCVCVCFSAHGSGCVVDGGSATAAI